MPYAATAEIYFIAIMMILIVIVCIVATWAFIRQYKREMKNKEDRRIRKGDEKQD